VVGENVEITGVENLRKIFEQFPEFGYRKPVMAGFRKAAKPVAAAMASNLPSNLKVLKRIIKIKPGKGKSLTLSVGFTGGTMTYRNSRGQTWDPYQLAYWFNYGTYANRLSSHQFKTPRRKISAMRKGGLTPGLFAEKAWEESQGKAQSEFEKEADLQIVKFFEKHALK